MPATRSIDLNADLGESFGAWRMGDDDALLPLVSSANVACGFHAGDPLTALRTCRAAAAHGVAIGAHVAYPDLVGFGRRDMDLSPAELEAAVAYQLGALAGIARAAGAPGLTHLKPHGALYHRVAVDPLAARAVARAVSAVDARVAVVGPPESAMLTEAAAAGLPTLREAFADRAYRPDGSLVPRGEPGAVLHDPSVVARRVVRLAVEGVVEAVTGEPVPVAADTVCLHGDTAEAVTIARAVRAALAAAQVAVAAPSGLGSGPAELGSGSAGSS